MLTLIRQIMESINHEGTLVYDQHFKRTVLSVNGLHIKIPIEILIECSKKEHLEKYEDDYARMKIYLDFCIKEYQDNKNSRQLLILNTDKYFETKQCFQLIQFINNKNNQIDVIIYQRSSDIDKLEDDIIFFSHIIFEFIHSTFTSLGSVNIAVGNIHHVVKK